jgi:hypothetical protein
LGSIEGFFSPKFFLKPMSIIKEREEEISDERWGYWKEVEEVPAVLLRSKNMANDTVRKKKGGLPSNPSKKKGERA